MSEPHSQPESRTVTIPLDRLVLSPLNVRKTPPGAADQEELKSSLLAHGLLENLVVRAGENSLEALKIGALLKAQKRKKPRHAGLWWVQIFFEKNFRVIGEISPRHQNRLGNRHVMVYGLMYET